MFKGTVEKVSHEGGLLVSYSGACPALGSVMVDSSETYVGKVDAVIGNLNSSLVHIAHLDRKTKPQNLVGIEITIRTKKQRDNQKLRDNQRVRNDRNGRGDRQSRNTRGDRSKGRVQDNRRNSRDRRDNRGQKKETHSRNDWICGECGNSNFSFRTECNRCKAPKRRNSRGPPKQWSGNDRRAGDRIEKPQQRPGDWECRGCGKMNFAKRNECFSCGAPKRVGGPKRRGHHRSQKDPPPLHSAKYGRSRRDKP